MRTPRDRNRRALQLEMLEIRTAPSHMGVSLSGADIRHHHSEHPGRHQAQVQILDNHQGQGRGVNHGNRGPGINRGPGSNSGPGQSNSSGQNSGLGRNDTADNDQNEHRGGGHH
jgi:hypothetical protein